MKRRLGAVAAVFALAIAAPSGLPAGSPGGPGVALAKPCGAGFTHAVINRAHKCLRRGQFCARGADSQYHRYGFHCHKRDARGNYHLT